ncbi:hypothetical protein JR316_0000273 [Psilocybe cubensis]|uniref:Uncharacterized protein n=2 Tax=Psilocybe cubensis TaxID=181762 RepID=A0A8H7Y962_PSICU|nr:hypothetical protein JR316_0000273 [Psilocybe cubensis]KAH9486209.1 hypothetical protein JR316_0000273 [Psilocybe cubensis]
MAQTATISHAPASESNNPNYTKCGLANDNSWAHLNPVKVGGRRLSISAKPKPHSHVETTNTDTSKVDEAAPDYPRPAPPTGGDAPLHHNYQHNEEEIPKKEKIEKKLQELAHRKVEMTRPTREANISKSHGMGMRISQPAGKSLGV